MLKINDKVIQIDKPELGIGIILGITHDPEALYSIDFPFLRCTRRRCQLKPYKEMKEERNITLTLNKAKEWYKKGGELREIALQAFSEKELTKIDLPKTWEEFCDNYPMKGGISYIDITSDIRVISSCDNNDFRDKVTDRNMCPSKQSAEAHLAMIQLEQLRNCWQQGWKPNWNDVTQTKYCIIHYGEEFKISVLCETRYFLSFPTREMAKEFLECFRDLIEKAGDLI